jgi:hypothetical protein
VNVKAVTINSLILLALNVKKKISLAFLLLPPGGFRLVIL